MGPLSSRSPVGEFPWEAEEKHYTLSFLPPSYHHFYGRRRGSAKLCFWRRAGRVEEGEVFTEIRALRGPGALKMLSAN